MSCRGSLVDNAQIQRREITVPIDSKTFALKSARRPICVIMDIFNVASSHPSTRVRMYGKKTFHGEKFFKYPAALYTI